jgi:hypothetical protein
MEFISAKCSDEQLVEDDNLTASAGSVRKYTYVLPSGRRLKVVVDDEADFVQTGSSTPCFVLRMEDDPES